MKIFVVQYEEGGIPAAPKLVTDRAKAEKITEGMMVEDQRFRKRKKGESFEAYREEYWDAIGIMNDAASNSPGFDSDDTVRIWEIEMLAAKSKTLKYL